MNKYLINIFIFLFFIANTLVAQQDSLTLFETLYGEEIPHFHIKTKLKKIIRKKAKKENHVGVLTYQDKEGNPQEYTIKIRARGNMRNKQCFLPPLKIDFKKGDLRGAGIRGNYDDLKMVVRCKRGDSYEDYVLKEYLTYKLYNSLTDISFRVQLIKLTLEDTEGKQKNIEAYAFLIESIEELAERVNAVVRINDFFRDKFVDPPSYDRMCVFEFMIGNADWHTVKQHNTKIVVLNDSKIAVTIPYDFDYSAIVGTPYATPHTQLPIDNIKDRYYLGLCRAENEYDVTFELFQAKKAEILALVEQFELLSEKPKKSMLKYLNSFFEILETPKKYKAQIINHCGKHIKAY